MTEYSVCVDCYISYHYGYRAVDAAEDYAIGYPGDDTGLADGLWWVGESDQVTDREPLHRVPSGMFLHDDTCSNHYYGQDEADDECDQCGRPADDGTGIDTFSWSRCDGCGSTLGGSRYRMTD